MRITSENTLAIVIDLQEKLVPAILDNETVVKNSEILIKGLNALGVPIIVTQQYTKGLGETVPEIKEALGEYTPYEKVTFSVWHTEEIKNAIKSTGRRNILICGTEAHICALQSTIDLRAEGYNVFFVEDCVGSRKKNDKKFGCKRAAAEGAFLTTYEAILYEITAQAGTPEFKAVSALTK